MFFRVLNPNLRFANEISLRNFGENTKKGKKSHFFAENCQLFVQDLPIQNESILNFLQIALLKVSLRQTILAQTIVENRRILSIDIENGLSIPYVSVL